MAKRAQKSAGGDADNWSFQSINPAEILAGWWQAITVSAGAIIGPALNIAGIKTPKLKKDELAQAVRGFPVVGLGMGLAAALIYAIAHGLNLPPLISAIIAVSTLALLGGANSEGGLSRFADTIITGGTKTAQLARLKDDTFGTYGTIVLIVALGLRIGALATIADTGAVIGALAATMAASWASVPVLLHYLPPARRSGFAHLAGRPSRYQTMLGLALGAAVALWFLGPVTGFIALGVGALGAFKFAWFAKRSLGGTTGDVLGAAQQGAEIGMLLAIVARA
ncbi:MAG: adenosylcobinamide-GDP ribazoletransferase [Alphaproteobacteria bacterium]|nr:adenosylcobinamide-GDP ribazoletransferase [Alphaproteobacteria bacterium]